MQICTPQSLCDTLRFSIQGEAGDPKQRGIVQLTTVDVERRVSILKAVGFRSERHGPFVPFKVCPFCSGALPSYPKPTA